MAKGVLRIKVLGDISHFQRSMKGLSGSLGGIAGKAAAAGAALGAMVITKSIGAFMEFDDAMTQSLAIMGDVSDGMRTKMSEAAREVGMTTRKSATEAAESYYYLASAGMDAQQALEAMPLVAQFAQAGMFDMALATDLLTDAQTALGLSFADMPAVADVLVKAAQLSNATVEQFSKSLTNKGAQALKTWKVSMEQGVAVLAAFASQGVKGEEAGTQLNIVLRDLIGKADENADVFEEFGVHVFDSTGALNDMSDVVGDLERLLGPMEARQKKATLSMMGFTDKSMASMLALLGTSDAIRDYEEALEDSAGTTEEVAEKQEKSIAGAWDRIKGSFEEAAYSLVEEFEDEMVELAAWLEGNMPAIIESFRQLGAMIAWAARQVAQLVRELGVLELGMGKTIVNKPEGFDSWTPQAQTEWMIRQGLDPSQFMQGGGPVPGSGAVPIVAHEGEYVLTSGDTELMQALIGSVGGGNAAVVGAINGLRRDARRGTGAVWTRPTPLGAWGVL